MKSREEILAYKKKYRENNKDKILAYSKQYELKNKVERTKYYQGWKLRNPSHRRNRHLRTKWNMTNDEFESMAMNQNLCCAICGIHESNLNQSLSIDHCHATGKIRALLCRHCNLGIGFFKENVKSLEKAIEYIKQHNAPQVVTPTEHLELPMVTCS